MNTLNKDDFLKWAAEKGIQTDSRYPHSAELTFDGGSDSRFWCVPSDPRQRPSFIAAMLELMGEWKTCYVWRHLGRWPEPDLRTRSNPNSIIELLIAQKIGLPRGGHDIVVFDRSEYDALLTLIFVTICFGWSVGDDLYIVPDHATQILRTDHHDVIHADFRSQKDVERWVDEMSRRGFDLPDDLPDATFKRPS